MPESLSSSPSVILTCTLSVAAWIVALVGLCTSHAFTSAISWWIIIFELIITVLSVTVFWTNSTKIYYPVILCLIAISIPYATNEVASYIFFGKPSLSAAAAGYIVMIMAQFSWIFMLGIQHEASVLRSFSDLNHHRIYTSSMHCYQKDHPSSNTIMFGNSPVLDASYTNSLPTPPQAVYPSSNNPLCINTSSESQVQNTVFLSPHSEYLLPVKAIHSYRANKEDPNELSFAKGEVLLVHDKRGSWWQAKKSNGAIGMIPSNYVTDHEESSTA